MLGETKKLPLARMLTKSGSQGLSTANTEDEKVLMKNNINSTKLTWGRMDLLVIGMADSL
jgi:hypothetical protein